jgi:hypothetical protein
VIPKSHETGVTFDLIQSQNGAVDQIGIPVKDPEREIGNILKRERDADRNARRFDL